MLSFAKQKISQEMDNRFLGFKRKNKTKQQQQQKKNHQRFCNTFQKLQAMKSAML